MKFGICIPNSGSQASREALVQSALYAEELGYDSVWVNDHVLPPRNLRNGGPLDNILECLTALAYVGAVTKGIRLGTSVLVLPMRDPILVAKQAATIDYLTGGRLILGTGVGWAETEFRNLGASFSDRGKRYEEYVKLIRTLYENEFPQFNGKYYRFRDAVFQPPPKSGEGPTLWFGGNSETAMRRAARLADGWQPIGLSVSRFASSTSILRHLLPRDRPFTLSLRMEVDVGVPPRPFVTAHGNVWEMIGGTHDEVIKTIQEYRDVGLDYLVCYFGDVRFEELKMKMKQFADEIMIAFHE